MAPETGQHEVGHGYEREGVVSSNPPSQAAHRLGSLPLALYLLWHRRWRLALIVALVPSILASYVLIRYADLEAYKQSRFGEYIAGSMTRSMEGVRLVGAGLMMLGVWQRRARRQDQVDFAGWIFISP